MEVIAYIYSMSLPRRTWHYVRNHDNVPKIAETIQHHIFPNTTPINITHIRTAHYAVFRVTTSRVEYIVRVGVASYHSFEPHNSGPCGVATTIAHDQLFEYTLGTHLGAHHAQIITPLDYKKLPNQLDALLLEYIPSDRTHGTTEQWTALLQSFRDIPRSQKLPVFNNYTKTKARIEQLDDASRNLLQEYESQMAHLFSIASRWGIVHGDLHAENVIFTHDKILAYDLDTTSWAPAVWDITHLGLRHGTGANIGYDINKLREQLGYSHEEYTAALQLRSLASEIARRANDLA